MKWLLTMAITFTAAAQPDYTGAINAKTPDELVRWAQREMTAMDNIYGHSEYDGSNGASDGTLARPYTTVAQVQAVAGSNDSVFLGGVFHEGPVEFTSLSNLTIRTMSAGEVAQVPGATTVGATYRGDVIATG